MGDTAHGINVALTPVHPAEGSYEWLAKIAFKVDIITNLFFA